MRTVEKSSDGAKIARNMIMAKTVFQMNMRFDSRPTIWRKKTRKQILTANMVIQVKV